MGATKSKSGAKPKAKRTTTKPRTAATKKTARSKTASKAYAKTSKPKGKRTGSQMEPGIYIMRVQ